MAETDAVKVENLCAGYEQKILLNNLSFSIPANSFTAIAGPNGAGKSTLLKLIIKELKKEKGEICVLGRSIEDFNLKELASNVSFVAQNSSRNYEFTVREFVALGRYCYGDESSNIQDVENAMQTAGVEELKDKLITRISGGEFQMTVLARALCQNTPVILLDEPVNNLDPFHQLSMMKLLKKLSKEGKTVICVLHDLNSIMAYSDYCILLEKGKIHSCGKTSVVLTEKSIKEVYKVGCRFINQEDGRTPLIVCYSL